MKRVTEPLTPERRREQTREYLLAAAAEVFAERGFHGATLDEVAAVAGYTKGAVYSNFKSKDDLFVALLESRYESGMRSIREQLDAAAEPHQASAFTDRLTEGFADATSGTWNQLYEEFLVYAMRNPQAKEKLAELQTAELQALSALLAAERERHGISDIHTVDHAAQFIVALMRGLATMHLIEASEIDHDTIAAMLDFLERALSPASD